MNSIEKLKDALEKFDRSKCELPDWLVNAMIAQIESVVEDDEKKEFCDEFPLEKELVDDYFSGLEEGDKLRVLTEKKFKDRNLCDIGRRPPCYCFLSYDKECREVCYRSFHSAKNTLCSRKWFKIPQSFVDEWRKEHEDEKVISIKSEECSNNNGVFRYECYCESKGVSFNEFCKRMSLGIGDMEC